MTVQDDLIQIIAELELRRAQLHVRLLQEALHEGDPALIGQNSPKSELGRRAHVEAVRRRVEAHEPGAFIRGRRFLLTPEAHADELARTTARAERKIVKAKAAVPVSEDAEGAELEEMALRKMRAR